MDKPIIFLDVDGVLNVDESEYALDEHHITIPRGTFRVLLAPEVGRRLAATGAELRWLTTWLDDAHEIARRIGLPDGLEVAGSPRFGELRHGTWGWKLEAVQESVAREGRPFVWIDDDAVDRYAREWACELELPHLLISPNSTYGLGVHELDEIDDFLAGLEGSSGEQVTEPATA